jgi:HTH-type transcriptional regulator, sugar sensing transcriptional regulator
VVLAKSLLWYYLYHIVGYCKMECRKGDSHLVDFSLLQALALSPDRCIIYVETNLQHMIIPDFELLGLSETEGKVYMALLELGGGYVSTVARKAALPRVNCYHTLENLAEKGLVNFVTKEKIRYYSAEPPQKILNIMEGRMSYAKKILPELLSITNTLALKPKIKYYEGMEGVKNILADTLTAKKELVGYSNLKFFAELFGDYIKSYSQQKMKKGIKTRLICPSSDEAFAYVKKYYAADFPADLIEILYVNPREFWFENEIVIYDDKVAVISLNRDELNGMIFESPVYARSQRAIFNLAWLGASSFIAL